jgi:alpha-galactosidase
MKNLVFPMVGIVGLCFLTQAASIPLQLPSPDGKAGDSTQPVKVYVLSGQSNMVGMGDIKGATPPFTHHYYLSDPTLIPGTLPVGAGFRGPVATLPFGKHGLYDAKATIFDKAAGKVLASESVHLGKSNATLPPITGTQVLVVRATIDAPVTGNYVLRAGTGASSHNVIQLAGKEIYRKDRGGKAVVTQIALEAGKRYPIEITYSESGSAAFWLEQVEIPGIGDLIWHTRTAGKYPYLIDGPEQWSVRSDVTYIDPRLFPTRASSSLSATSNNGGTIGPELGFGHVMGLFHNEQVLLIKCAMGNRSLDFDFRPPSSDKTNREGAETWEGLEYRLMIEGVKKTLAEIEKVVPGYAGQGYEIAGFGWFQGHKDSGSSKEAYEKNLVHLIKDLRTDLHAPQMKAVVATVGFHGYEVNTGNWKGVWEAQMAVGDAKQHPELSGSVASVDTRDFWRERSESPRDQDYHYHRNPETYLLIGEAMGRAMVRLFGGDAETPPKSEREAATAKRVAERIAEAARPAPTAAQVVASREAVKPVIMEATIPDFIANPRVQPAILAAHRGTLPAKPNYALRDELDSVVDHYKAAGVQTYNWKPIFGTSNETWDYLGFNLPEGFDLTKPIADLATILPQGQEKWHALDFDAKKSGWKNGAQTFGVAEDRTIYPDWFVQRYGGSRYVKPKTVVENDVLLLRGTFDLPPLKENHRYRILINGSPHTNSGDAYAIFVNGKPMAFFNTGITAWRREGGQPRGAHITGEFRKEFSQDKVTLAIASFPAANVKAATDVPPAGASLSISIEEMPLPDIGL